jgi:hypothetical protein
MKKLLLIISLFGVCAFAGELWLDCSVSKSIDKGVKTKYKSPQPQGCFIINTDNAKPICSRYYTKGDTYDAYISKEDFCEVTNNFIKTGNQDGTHRHTINRINGEYTMNIKDDKYDLTRKGTCKPIPPIVEKVEKPLF